MNPICCSCGIEMICHRNGVFVKAAEEHYYSGDMYRCPECGQKVICGFGLPFHSKNEKVEVDLTEAQQCLFES